MKRMLIALALAAAAHGAHATEAEADELRAGDCPKVEEAPARAAPAENAAGNRPGTPAPVRPRAGGTSRGGPRWHSLLPGMIR